VVIVCVWRLLSLVAKNRIFTAASLRWVDSIVWAIAAVWVTLVAGSSTSGSGRTIPGC
ncbi:MAG: hypothetical protein JWN20_2061, partial [Jatrophihabitantaceae bacterium]|nr:hypothetical protein [Jatrophihabitantaceae bacterium]